LENARFLRYGQIHRNTYINAPTVLRETLQMRRFENVFFAGQICGVEGYTESIAAGLIAGIGAARLALGDSAIAAPRESAFGSLMHYITHADSRDFQPANITFDLLPQLDESTRKNLRDKAARHKLVCEQALASFDTWLYQVGTTSRAAILPAS
jgi:methylenetetrahydrofolate--tRNA-(uracil-5-)-methyltransferase